MPRAAQTRNRLPEQTTYRDTGCPDLGIPLCSRCPVPDCRYCLPPKVASAMLRYLRLRPYLDAGLTADEAAAATGMSRRSVFRLKQVAEWYAALLEVEA